jgi:thiamine-monophosphate kinase
MKNIDWLWAGIQAAAKEHNISNVTIDLSSSMTGLIISCTSVGRQEKKIVDTWPKTDKTSLLCVTGNLGAAYMGLHVLEREKVAFGKVPPEKMKDYQQPDLSKYKYILGQYLTPEINSKSIENFKEAGFYPSTGYFITKGLGDTIKQLCKETGFGAKVYLDKIPIAPESRAMADEIGIDIITSVINGGDDYRLLYVVPLEKHEQLHKEMGGLRCNRSSLPGRRGGHHWLHLTAEVWKSKLKAGINTGAAYMLMEVIALILDIHFFKFI